MSRFYYVYMRKVAAAQQDKSHDRFRQLGHDGATDAAAGAGKHHHMVFQIAFHSHSSPA